MMATEPEAPEEPEAPGYLGFCQVLAGPLVPVGAVGRGRRRRHRGDVRLALVLLLVLLVLGGGVFLGLDEGRLLAGELGDAGVLVRPVVVQAAVDVHAIGHRIAAQRVAVPDDQIGVLARLNRAHAIGDAQLARRVHRHQRQRLVVGQAAPLDRLGGLGVEAAGMLGAVGVDRHQHALAGHQGGVPRRGAAGLDLVAPPVGEGGRPGAVRGDLLGDLVALQHVLQRRDAEADFLGQPQQHQDLVGAIAVRVDQAPALEHLHQRFELQVAPRRNRGRVLLLACGIGGPLGLVRPGPRERVANHELHAHAAGRIAARSLLAELPHVLRVLAQRELDARQRAGKAELVGRRPCPSAA